MGAQFGFQLQKIASAPKIPEKVMQALISTMERGLIRVGEELPPERDLAAGLGVSRNSLRECLAILEYMGIIETQGNRKIVVKDASYFQKAVAFVRISSSADILQDTLEFRGAISCAAVTLACERATDEDLAQMHESLERLDQNPHDRATDIEFHTLLMNASHNALFSSTMELLDSLLTEPQPDSPLVAEYHEKNCRSHHRIYQALQDRDAGEAMAAITEHLQLLRGFTQATLSSDAEQV